VAGGNDPHTERAPETKTERLEVAAAAGFDFGQLAQGLAFSLILMARRQLVPASDTVRAGIWQVFQMVDFRGCPAASSSAWSTRPSPRQGMPSTPGARDRCHLWRLMKCARP
jgi:hypothetical protein